MFSSLLPKPRHSEHDPNIKLSLLASKKNPELVFERNLVTKAPEKQISISLIKFEEKELSNYEATIPLKKRYPNLKHYFPRYTPDTCPDDSIQETLEETREVIRNILEPKIAAKNEVSTVTITPRDGKDEKLIQIRNYQEDPMLPAKFKLQKNRNRPPSPPPTLLRKNENEAKLSKEDREKWKIPAALSNWKNNQGFIISLDKRIKAASGGTLQQAEFNVDKFSDFTTALENAEKEAREEIRVRNEMRKALALKEQEEREQRQRYLSDITRDERNDSHKRRKH